MSETETPSGGLNVKRLLPVAVLVAGLVAFFAFDLDRFVTLDALKTHREALQGWVDSQGVGRVAGLCRHLHGGGRVLDPRRRGAHDHRRLHVRALHRDRGRGHRRDLRRDAPVPRRALRLRRLPARQGGRGHAADGGGIQREPRELHARPPAGSVVPVLAGQPGAGLSRREAPDLFPQHAGGHYPGDVRLRAGRRRSRRGARRGRGSRSRNHIRAALPGTDYRARGARLYPDPLQADPGAARGNDEAPGRPLRHWGRVGRSQHCRRRVPDGRLGGVDRARPDGRRLPQCRMRAVEGADRGRGRRRGRAGRRQVRHSHRPARDRFRPGARPCPRRDRGDRPARFGRALRGARRDGDPGARPLHRPAHGGRGRARDRGAALRHRHRLQPGGAADPGARRRSLSHQRDGLRSYRPALAAHRHRRRPDRARTRPGASPPRRRGDGAGDVHRARQGRSGARGDRRRSAPQGGR